MDTINKIGDSLNLIDSIQSEIADEYTDLFELAKQVNKTQAEFQTQLPYHINV